MPAQRDVLRHAPWTCQWGEFGGVLGVSGRPSQPLSPGARRWSPWVCLHPDVRPEWGYLAEGDCNDCPFWTGAVDRTAS
jgi:hypothetical protein